MVWRETGRNWVPTSALRACNQCPNFLPLSPRCSLKIIALVCLCVRVQVHLGPEKALELESQTWELPDVGADNLTWILCKGTVPS